MTRDLCSLHNICQKSNRSIRKEKEIAIDSGKMYPESHHALPQKVGTTVETFDTTLSRGLETLNPGMFKSPPGFLGIQTLHII